MFLCFIIINVYLYLQLKERAENAERLALKATSENDALKKRMKKYEEFMEMIKSKTPLLTRGGGTDDEDEETESDAEWEDGPEVDTSGKKKTQE